MGDTICAVSTASSLTPAAIGIVRISGPRAAEMATILFEPRLTALDPWPHGRLILGTLRLPRRDISAAECLACRFVGPRSYTGEDVIEFHCPGNPVLLSELLAELVEQGCRVALPGEFTRRAWENGRIELPAAELLNELIRARTRSAVRAAGLEQASRGLVRDAGRLRDSFVEIASRVEAAIEFGETDGIMLNRSETAADLAALAAKMERLAASYSTWRAMRDGTRVTIVGKANVGKSTLFNQLCGEDRAIVHPEPGTTRDALREALDISGVSIVLYDTAGHRSLARVGEVESEGLRRAERIRTEADVVLVVVDGSCPPDASDRAVLAACAEKPSLLVINKIDLGSDPAWADPRIEAVRVSLRDGDGLPALRESLAKMVASNTSDDAPVVVTLRQKGCLENAAKGVRGAIHRLEEGEADEVVAEELRAAARALSELLGEIPASELVDRIFSEFCIGK